jgi:cell division protein FtsB
MGFWERVKKDLQVAVREGVGLLKEGSTTLTTEASRLTKKGAVTVRSETRRVAKLGKLRYQLYLLNRKAQSRFMEIGGMVYDQASKDLEGFRLDAKLRELVLETQQIEEQIQTLDSEILSLSKGKQNKAA